MSFDYKKYSLENLENWVHDAMSADNATAEEIYDCIYKVVFENFSHHRHYMLEAYKLMEKMNGNNPYSHRVNKTEEDVKYTDEELDAMCDAAAHADMISKVELKPEKKSWIIPVEEVVDDDTYETDYTITFPDDFLEKTGWKEGDEILWIDRKDGTYEIRKLELKED